MRTTRVAVRAERLGPAFDLLAAYAPGGFFLERAGVGVAGSAGRREPWGMAISGPQMRSGLPTLENLFAGFDVEALPSDAPAPLLFGSIPFDPERSGRFLFPVRTVRRDRDGETWELRLDEEDGDVAVEAERGGSEPSAPFSKMQVFPEPLPDVYERAVTEAVGTIKQGSLRKVVLARTIRVEAGRRLDPRGLVKHLRAVEPDGYSFAVDTGMGRTLVGASPELLISRFADEIRANPLAGSAPRAGDPGEDRENAERLGTSAKDRQEHAIVVEDVFRALHPLCQEPHVRPRAATPGHGERVAPLDAVPRRVEGPGRHLARPGAGAPSDAGGVR